MQLQRGTVLQASGANRWVRIIPGRESYLLSRLVAACRRCRIPAAPRVWDFAWSASIRWNSCAAMHPVHGQTALSANLHLKRRLLEAMQGSCGAMRPVLFQTAWNGSFHLQQSFLETMQGSSGAMCSLLGQTASQARCRLRSRAPPAGDLRSCAGCPCHDSLRRLRRSGPHLATQWSRCRELCLRMRERCCHAWYMVL